MQNELGKVVVSKLVTFQLVWEGYSFYVCVLYRPVMRNSHLHVRHAACQYV